MMLCFALGSRKMGALCPRPAPSAAGALPITRNPARSTCAAKKISTLLLCWRSLLHNNFEYQPMFINTNTTIALYTIVPNVSLFIRRYVFKGRLSSIMAKHKRKWTNMEVQSWFALICKANTFMLHHLSSMYVSSNVYQSPNNLFISI